VRGDIATVHADPAAVLAAAWGRVGGRAGGSHG